MNRSGLYKLAFTFMFICLITLCSAQAKTDDWFKGLLYSNASDTLISILNQPDIFQYQVIYTRIDRDRKGRPHFKNYFLNVDRNKYFNPASTVKMPVAFLTLEKINTLSKYGVDKSTTMLTDSAYRKQSKVLKDTSAENKMPSIEQYIKKIFLVSDNDAYNRLYEFLGQQYINEELRNKGYTDIRITRRFVPMDADENRYTNPVTFMKDGKRIYHQPEAYSQTQFKFPDKILIGKGHYNSNDSLVNAPMDFTTHNNLPLEDLQQILQSVIFPNSVSSKKKFKLTKEDYQFLYQYMSELPRESRFPFYDTTEYFDSYTKFFWFKAGKQKLPPYIRSFNKPGWSYGFLTDAAYIADFKHNVEFMISGVIYVNKDGILNDDKYEYEEIGYPFFKEVGQIIYQYELKRKRKYQPDLSRFKMEYH